MSEQSRAARSLRERASLILPPLLTGAALIALWHVAVKTTGTKVFPAPAAVLRAFGELWRRGVLVRYVSDSLLRVVSGYGLAVVVGVPIGVAMGESRTADAALNPVIEILRPISPLAWIPIAIALFGVGNPSTVFLIFLGALFPVVVAAADGVRGVPRIYLWGAQNFGLSRVERFRRVVLPASLPHLLSGLRVALGVAWLVVVAAEMVAIDSGLGYLIIDSRNAGKRYDLVVAGMLLIGVIGLALDAAVRRIERLRAVRWGFREE